MAAKDVLAALITQGWKGQLDKDYDATGATSCATIGLVNTVPTEYGEDAHNYDEQGNVASTFTTGQKSTLNNTDKTFTSTANWGTISKARLGINLSGGGARSDYVDFDLTPTFAMLASGYQLTITSFTINIGTVTGAT